MVPRSRSSWVTAQGQEGDPKPLRWAASSLPPMWGLSSSQTRFPRGSQRGSQDCRRSTAIFCSTRTARTYFINFSMYASHPLLRTPPATSSQLNPLQRAPRIAVWSRVPAAVWLHVPAFHFASVLLKGLRLLQGRSPQAAAAAARKAKSQGREAQSLRTRRAANCKTQQLAAEMRFPAP